VHAVLEKRATRLGLRADIPSGKEKSALANSAYASVKALFGELRTLGDTRLLDIDAFHVLCGFSRYNENTVCQVN
jgi:hypothetical protein